MFILVDHEDRENEGDICIPAEMATADVINFMASFGRGLICLALTGERVDQLGLPLMTTKNSSRHETAFTVSIEAREGIETGISAHDRARTVAVAIAEDRGAQDLATPGHMFPLRARDGGTLVRAGHTEAVVDIARLAGLNPSGVICEVMNEDGTMARLHDLAAFGQRHGIKIGTISDLIAHRRRYDPLLREISRREVQSNIGGCWTLRVFADPLDGIEHVVLTKGDVTTPEPVLVHTHTLQAVEDALGIGTGADLQAGLEIIAQAGRGALVLLGDARPSAQVTPDAGWKAQRERTLGGQILSSLGLKRLVILGGQGKDRHPGLDAYGLEIVETRPIRG